MVSELRKTLDSSYDAGTIAREAAVKVFLFHDYPEVIVDKEEKHLRVQVSYLERIIKEMKKQIKYSKKPSPPMKRKRDAEETDVREKKKQQVPSSSSHIELAEESIKKDEEVPFDEFDDSLKDFFGNLSL